LAKNEAITREILGQVRRQLEQHLGRRMDAAVVQVFYKEIRGKEG
jgi:hypothetical protein